MQKYVCNHISSYKHPKLYLSCLKRTSNKWADPISEILLHHYCFSINEQKLTKI